MTENISDIDWTFGAPIANPAPVPDAVYEPWAPVRNKLRDVGRNDPCPCGSGKKFKKCCGA